MVSKPRRCLALRHVAFEDLGFFADVLAARGFAIGYREAALDDLGAADLRDCDLLVILGGPIGVYERDAYPFLGEEIALAEARLARKQPTLGICLGSQIMAAALGADVYPGKAGKEVGWGTLNLTPSGATSPLAHLAADRTRVLHWHGDTFDLPKGATLLASTDRYAQQAFAYDRAGLALQFHPEVTAKGLEAWFVGHCCEIAALRGTDVKALRAATQRHAPALARQGKAFFEAWLDSIGLAA
ncbi:MAG: glutamine amidotransferase [Candidatus Odyssella sp.]|nr:glutamine amidotransferase [Candidatus Odyssella sp.]